MRFCMPARLQRLWRQSLLFVVNSERQKGRPLSLEAESRVPFRASDRLFVSNEVVNHLESWGRRPRAHLPQRLKRSIRFRFGGMGLVYRMKCPLVKRLPRGESYSKHAACTLIESCYRGVK